MHPLRGSIAWHSPDPLSAQKLPPVFGLEHRRHGPNCPFDVLLARPPIDDADPHCPATVPDSTAKKRRALAIDCLDHSIGSSVVVRSGGVRTRIWKSHQSLIQSRISDDLDARESA